MMHPLFTKSEYTIGELYDAVFVIHEPAEARAFYDDYIAWAKTHADPKYRSQEGAEFLVKSNIGWIFGEGMPQVDINMWVSACGAAHPIFGSMTTPPTSKEAFQAGLEFADKRS